MTIRQISNVFFLVSGLLFSCNSNKTSSKDKDTNIDIAESVASDNGKINGEFGGCGYNYTPNQTSITIYNPGQRELDQIRNILKFSGLPTNFEVYSADIKNAVATIINGKRYIIYDPKLLIYSDLQSSNYWSSMSILAHEIGHHLSGHTLGRKGSNLQDEIEADKFSGFILYKLGATLNQASSAINTLGDETDSETHPSKYKRIAAITKGWNEAAELRYESAVPPPPTDENSNTPFWGQEEFTPEELICSGALADPSYGGVINSYNHPYLEGIIIDVTKSEPTYGVKAELCGGKPTDFNMILTIEFTKVSMSPFPEVKRRNGQREKFHLTEYYNNMSELSHPGLSALEAILVPGRKIRFRSFYYGYGSEDIFYIKKLKRSNNSSSQIEINKESTSGTKNYLVVKDRAYFYSQPNLSFQTRAYLVNGEIISGTEIKNGFVYTDFINPRGRKTSGWIDLSDLLAQ